MLCRTIEDIPLMHMQTYKGRKQFKFLIFAGLSFTLIFLTVIVMAKSPEIQTEFSVPEEPQLTHEQLIEHYSKSAEEFKFEKKGTASWYGPGFHGKHTANGEIYDQNKMTAAQKILPTNTWVRVTNQENNKSVVVRINDRGPYKK